MKHPFLYIVKYDSEMIIFDSVTSAPTNILSSWRILIFIYVCYSFLWLFKFFLDLLVYFLNLISTCDLSLYITQHASGERKIRAPRIASVIPYTNGGKEGRGRRNVTCYDSKIKINFMIHRYIYSNMESNFAWNVFLRSIRVAQTWRVRSRNGEEAFVDSGYALQCRTHRWQPINDTYGYTWDHVCCRRCVATGAATFTDRIELQVP